MLTTNPVVSRVLSGILSEQTEESFARMRKRRTDVPRGPALPHALQLTEWVANPIAFLRACQERFGSVFTVQFPQSPLFVMFSDPNAIKEIFTSDVEDLRAGQANIILEPVLGKHSLLLLDGAEHLRERRLLMPSFHGERMQAYVRVMRDLTQAAIKTWKRGEPMRVHPEAQAITLDVIVHTIFGVDESEGVGKLRDTLKSLLNIGSNPLLLMPMFQHDLGRLSPWGRVAILKRKVDAELFALIAAARVRNREGREDILSMLIDARDETGRALSDRELHDEMITMLIAGHETTATTLSWMFHWLSQRPDIQEELRAEIEQVTGGAPLQAGHIAGLKLLDAVCKETMRLSPVVPVVGRHLARPMTIGGHDLPEGAIATPCIYLTHRNPAYWPNPDEFDPQRFMDTRINPYAYLPFGGGARRCIGLAFATMEMKVVMATVLGAIRFRKVPGEETRTVRRGVTFVPSNGMPVIIE
ncbi:MAG: cytochrome P450 [Sandaracinaceae bacterium]|nr:cytochrome P450 [Sandaracinaceae bacterium]